MESRPLVGNPGLSRRKDRAAPSTANGTLLHSPGVVPVSARVCEGDSEGAFSVFECANLDFCGRLDEMQAAKFEMHS
jgi:hypothetical protein